MIRKSVIGTVVSDKMNKTIVVEVERRTLAPLFKKYLRRTTRFKVHDEKNEAKVGQRVAIVGTRPLSREKSWRLEKVL